MPFVSNPGSGGLTFGSDTEDSGTDQWPIAKMGFGLSGSGQRVSPSTPMPMGTTGSYFVVSTANSSTSQLAPGQSFVGTIEALPTALDLSLNIPTDQNLSVTVNFYQGSTANTFIGSYPPVLVTAGVGMNRSFETNGNYCNVIVTNIGVATTTLLVIDAQYGSIAPVDQAGNAPMAVNGTYDFAGINLLEECIKGELPLTATVTNPEQRDANGALMLSDAPLMQRLLASTAGQIFTIDTTGYQTLSISMGTMAATITGTNDLSAGNTPGAISAYPVVLGTPTSTLAAATNYLIPCLTRYIRITVTTAGWATYYQRSQALPASYLANAPVNITQIGGTANAAQGGMIAVGSSAASNGQTLGTQITPATPAALAVKAAAGRLMFLHVGNPNTSAVYCKVFNATTVTLGTTSATLNFYIPASSSLPLPISDAGLYFSTGIEIAVTGAASLTDNTAITTGCELNYAYI